MDPSALKVNGNVLLTGALASSAVTADQVILTYTVPAGKTFFLTYIEANVKLTTFAATATDFGPLSFRQNGTKLLTFQNAGVGMIPSPVYVELTEPMPWQAGDVLTIVCTPAAATAFSWEANIGGFLK